MYSGTSPILLKTVSWIFPTCSLVHYIASLDIKRIFYISDHACHAISLDKLSNLPQSRKDVCVEGDFVTHFFVPHVPAPLYAIADWTKDKHQTEEQPDCWLINS